MKRTDEIIYLLGDGDYLDDPNLKTQENAKIILITNDDMQLDDSKLIITFKHMWEVYADQKEEKLQPSPALKFIILDHDQDVLARISNFFMKNPDLMPPNSCIEFTDPNIDPERYTENVDTKPVQRFAMDIAIPALLKALKVDPTTGRIGVKPLPKGLMLKDFDCFKMDENVEGYKAFIDEMDKDDRSSSCCDPILHMFDRILFPKEAAKSAAMKKKN